MTATDGPLGEHGLRVCASECSTCVFRPGNLMQLRSGRLAGMVAESLQADAAIVCHKTLDGRRAVCRGFYDRHGRATLMCRFGAVLGLEEVNPDA